VFEIKFKNNICEIDPVPVLKCKGEWKTQIWSRRPGQFWTSGPIPEDSSLQVHSPSSTICYMHSDLNFFHFMSPIFNQSRSQRPRGKRRRSAAARLLGLSVRTPPVEWMFVPFECCILSGRGLCVWLTTHPEGSYWVWSVWVLSWIFDNEDPLAHWGVLNHGNKKLKQYNASLST